MVWKVVAPIVCEENKIEEIITVEELEQVKMQDSIVESGIIIIILDQSGSM